MIVIKSYVIIANRHYQWIKKIGLEWYNNLIIIYYHFHSINKKNKMKWINYIKKLLVKKRLFKKLNHQLLVKNYNQWNNIFKE
jgi:hypothetical protein